MKRAPRLLIASSGCLLFGLSITQVASAEKTAPSSPASSTDQWQRGLVRWQDQWLTPDEVAKQEDTRELLEQYRIKRDAAPRTIEGQLQLANWCAQQHLTEQERAHLTRLVELDPTHVEARRRLGFVLVDDVWMSREEIRRSKERARDVSKAIKRWSPQLVSIAAALASPNEKKQQVGKAKLMEINDTSAISAIELGLGDAGDNAGIAMAEAFASMTSPDASLALTRLALYSPSSAVRSEATKKLKTKPQEYYVPALLAELVTPIQSTISLYTDPSGRITYRHTFSSEGQESRNVTVIDQSFRRAAGGIVKNGQQVVNEEAALALAITEQSLTAEDNNERICKLLSKVTDLDLPAKPELWWSWWNDKTETYLAEAKPIYREYASRESVVSDATRFYGGSVVAAPSASSAPPRRCECLIAGTPVWTLSGPVAIEKIQVGDLVLAQNIESGELAYKAVLRTTTRPPTSLVAFKLPQETITASGGHLFWAEGKGWLRARQLETGIPLHTLDAASDVQSTVSAPAEQTYNLIVADFHTYFVGKSKLLSHDNTPRMQTAITTPGQSSKVTATASVK